MIRHSAEDAQSYTQDLLKWQEEQSQADLRRRQATSSHDGSSAAAQAPVRSRAGKAPAPAHSNDTGVADNEGEWRAKGNAEFKAGRYDAAIEAYTRALAAKATAAGYGNRALAHLRSGDAGKAEEDARQALRVDASFLKAWQRRAAARRALGRPLAAVADLEEALRLEPTSKVLAAERLACIAEAEAAEGIKPLTTWRRIPGSQAGQEAAAAAAAAVAQRMSKPGTLPPPRTGTELELAWRGLRGDAAAQAAYLAALDPPRLPTLLGAALTAPLLASLAQAALAALLPEQPSHAVAVLEGLAATPRFRVVAMCMAGAQRAELRGAWDAAAAAAAAARGPDLAGRLAAARRAFGL
ncbi:hypothetical protein WJX81_007264 [Elliptochloris bilobata]|uniref:RNA-polymerase II-associated protein 3-like C-terminal domain-containing protein n=1 Tax=Elliptochloris bilobata TaxID=381761 RepID=A0AAW1SCZ0_9CHLO